MKKGIERVVVGKVGLACSSFSGGGAERVMVNLANKFVEWGYQVDFVVGKDEGPYRESLSPRVNKYVLSPKRSSRVVRRVVALYRYVKYFRTDPAPVVMSTLREFNVFSVVARSLAFSTVKLYVREADTLDRLTNSSRIKDKIFLGWMRCGYKRSSGVIANCNITKDDLERCLGVSGVVRIYNPLDTFFIEEKKKESCPLGSIDVVACGRLDKKKNFNDLLDAICLVKNTHSGVKVVILGQGPEEARLREQVKELGLDDNVIMTGFVQNPYPYFASSKVFVQTSLWEGFGYVMAEAMACGVSVVSYDAKGAMREILRDGEFGDLVPMGDVNSLAHYIIRRLEDPRDGEELKRSVERFEINRIADEYLKLLTDS